jgi:polar amino acid transport system ATP-binding protein
VFLHQGLIHESGPPAEIFRGQKTPELQAFIASVL